MPTLYHYSPLIHLPAIRRVGLCDGEVALPGPDRRGRAVSLTTQTDPTRLLAWNVPLPWKTAVRYTCRIPDDDPKLEPALGTWKRLGVTAKYVRERLNPHGQARWWYFYHGTIPPDRFAVELWGTAGYVHWDDAGLERAAAEVAAARGEFEFFAPPGEPEGSFVRLKDEADRSALWLLEESHPADRFRPPV